MMSGESPRWNADTGSAGVLMEYLKRASPQYVAAELEELGLLESADEAAAAAFEAVAPRRASANVWMVALAMCAMIVVLAETLHAGSMNVLPDDDGPFMQLAGPTPEW
jgi:hypothetical protein